MELVLKNICLPLAEFTLQTNCELHSRLAVIFGPSGSGKTSLLDVVAGLRQPKSAFIRLNGDVLTDTTNSLFVPARQRRVGYVPQDLALFPHLSVGQNLVYGYRSNDWRFSFERVLDVLEIQPLVRRRVHELSGGEKQRVALGRALLTSPHLLLLDEPLANLDLPLKTRILPYLAHIRNEFGIPMLYVTHDRFEALSLAEEIVVLVKGQVAQIGPVQEVFSRPASLAVAGIVDVETVQMGRVIGTDNDLTTVAIGDTLLSAVAPVLPAGAKDVYACIRAEDVILLKGADTPSSPRNHLPAVVRGISREGALMRIDLECGFPLSALLTKQACEEMALAPGNRVVALVKAPHVHLIPR